MTYRGRIEQGVVVFDGTEKPPEGTVVSVEPVNVEPTKSEHQSLLKWAGTVEGLSSDSSVNLDHYLYGHPKK